MARPKKYTDEEKKERIKQCKKKWREKNKEKINEYSKKWQKENLIYVKSYHLQRYLNNKIVYDTYNQLLRLSEDPNCLDRYYKKNQEQILTYHEFNKLMEESDL